MNKSANLPGLLKKEIIDIVCKKYNVIKFIDTVKFSNNPDALAKTLEEFYCFQFNKNDRIVVLHHDTDYYETVDATGYTIYNFLRLCANFDISLSNVIILTNHYGIDYEIKKNAQSICNSTEISIVYTSQWYDFPDDDSIAVGEANLIHTTDIVKLYSCLNGAQRMHRVLTLCFLEEKNLLDNGIVSFNFNN